jgi:hypothetical protein
VPDSNEGPSSADLAEAGGYIGKAIGQVVGGQFNDATGTMLGSILSTVGSATAGDLYDLANDLLNGFRSLLDDVTGLSYSDTSEDDPPEAPAGNTEAVASNALAENEAATQDEDGAAQDEDGTAQDEDA